MLDHATLKVVHGLVDRSFGTAYRGVSDLVALDSWIRADCERRGGQHYRWTKTQQRNTRASRRRVRVTPRT